MATQEKNSFGCPFFFLFFATGLCSVAIRLSGSQPGLCINAAGRSTVTRYIVWAKRQTWICACRLHQCMVVQRVSPRRSDPNEFIHICRQEFIDISICIVSWIGGRAKAGTLPSTFDVKTRQSGDPCTGLGGCPNTNGSTGGVGVDGLTYQSPHTCSTNIWAHRPHLAELVSARARLAYLLV